MAFWILVKLLDAGLAAEFHDGAIVVVDVRLTHATQFLAGDDAHLQGVVVGFGALVRTALKAARKKECKESKEKTKDRQASCSHDEKFVFFAPWGQGQGCKISLLDAWHNCFSQARLSWA